MQSLPYRQHGRLSFSDTTSVISFSWLRFMYPEPHRSPIGIKVVKPGCCEAERQKGSRSEATANALVTPGLIFRPQKIVCSLTCPQYSFQNPWLFFQTRMAHARGGSESDYPSLLDNLYPSGIGWWINQKRWLSANSHFELTTPAIL